MAGRVLVLGGGVAGIAAARELARNEIQVYLVEKEPFLGGRVALYCCKATESCQQCGVCVLPSSLQEVEADPFISVFTGTTLKEAKRAPGGFAVTLEQHVADGFPQELRFVVDALVVATGFEPFRAAEKPLLGYGRYRRVLTGTEAEERLLKTGSLLPGEDGFPQNIAFIQCVGSRDVQLGAGYCSQVCCKYSLRLARLIQKESPETKITVFYMDLQTAGKGFAEFYNACKETVQFVRGLPVEVTSNGNGKLMLKHEDFTQGKVVTDAFDLLILAVGITPRRENTVLAQRLGINCDSFGFFAAESPLLSTVTNQQGIFLAGTCQGPKDISGAKAQGKEAATKVIDFLKTEG